MGKDDRFMLRWIVSYILPVASFILAAAALLLVMYLDQENQVLRQSVRTLQDIEIARQKARVDVIQGEVEKDMSRMTVLESGYSPYPMRDKPIKGRR